MDIKPLQEELNRLKDAGITEIYIRANQETGRNLAGLFVNSAISHFGLHIKIVFDPSLPDGKIVISDADKFLAYKHDVGLQHGEFNVLAALISVVRYTGRYECRTVNLVGCGPALKVIC